MLIWFPRIWSLIRHKSISTSRCWENVRSVSCAGLKSLEVSLGMSLGKWPLSQNKQSQISSHTGFKQQRVKSLKQHRTQDLGPWHVFKYIWKNIFQAGTWFLPQLWSVVWSWRTIKGLKFLGVERERITTSIMDSAIFIQIGSTILLVVRLQEGVAPVVMVQAVFCFPFLQPPHPLSLLWLVPATELVQRGVHCGTGSLWRSKGNNFPFLKPPDLPPCWINRTGQIKFVIF